MNFAVSRHAVNDGVVRLAVWGEVDVSTSPQLSQAIDDEILAAHAAELILDMHDVTFLDSVGVTELLRGRHLAAEHGVAYLVINATTAEVRAMLERSGVLHPDP